jgi:hypothetical protein
MKKLFLITVILVFSHIEARSDCAGFRSFIEEAANADLVALATISGPYFHGYLLNIVDIIKGETNENWIILWANSECHLDRDYIKGTVGDTVIIAVAQQNEDVICEAFYVKIIEKARIDAFHTNGCATNILKMENGMLQGHISKKRGTFKENSELKYYRSEDEVMDYNSLKTLIVEGNTEQ